MDFALLLKRGGLELAPGRRLVKADEYAHWLAGEEMLSAARVEAEAMAAGARAEAEAMVAAARAEAEATAAAARTEVEATALAARDVRTAEVERGYREGLERAAAERSERMFELAARTVDYFSVLETRVAELVTASLRRVLGEMDDADLVLRIVRQVLGANIGGTTVKLRVSRTVVARVRKSIGALVAERSPTTLVEVVGDPHLAPTSCILESELGMVDASLDLQLAALESAIEKSFTK